MWSTQLQALWDCRRWAGQACSQLPEEWGEASTPCSPQRHLPTCPNICSYSFEAGANGANEGGWKEAWWSYTSSLEVRSLVGVGCHMPRHIRPIIQVACNTGGREGSSCGRGEKGGQKQILAIHPLVSIETMGAMGPKSMALLREVGRRVAAESGEPRQSDNQSKILIQDFNFTHLLETV